VGSPIGVSGPILPVPQDGHSSAADSEPFQKLWPRIRSSKKKWDFKDRYPAEDVQGYFRNVWINGCGESMCLKTLTPDTALPLRSDKLGAIRKQQSRAASKCQTENAKRMTQKD
jgi:hypothetical protein